MEPFLIKTYKDAVRAGNTLLYLPREIRDEIYEIVILDDCRRPTTIYAKHTFNINNKNRWLPHLCEASDLTFMESMPIMFKHSLIIVEGMGTAVTLRNHLEIFDAFTSVRALHFTDISVLHWYPNAAELLQKCVNLRTLHLTIPVDKLASVLKTWKDEYVLGQIVDLKHLAKIVILLAESNCITSEPVKNRLDEFADPVRSLGQEVSKNGRRVDVKMVPEGSESNNLL